MGTYTKRGVKQGIKRGNNGDDGKEQKSEKARGNQLSPEHSKKAEIKTHKVD